MVGVAGRVAVISSFGAEAACLLSLVASKDPSTPVVFLDRVSISLKRWSTSTT